MGTWGMGSFENDDALGLAEELADGGGPEVIIELLRRVAEAGDDEYVEAPDSSMAVAAAEIVAADRGHSSDGLPEEVVGWLEAHRGSLAAHSDVARRAVARVAAKSELQELWDEAQSDDKAGWRQAIADLAARLG